MEITKEVELLHDTLMQSVLEKRKVNLNPVQEAKFNKACWKAIMDNEKLNFNELSYAANIYLNFILKFPEMTL